MKQALSVLALLVMCAAPALADSPDTAIVDVTLTVEKYAAVTAPELIVVTASNGQDAATADFEVTIAANTNVLVTLTATAPSGTTMEVLDDLENKLESFTAGFGSTPKICTVKFSGTATLAAGTYDGGEILFTVTAL